MSGATILFVHGTGVRLPSYRKSFGDAANQAAAHGVSQKFEQCAWGDAFGASFSPRSLPVPPSARYLQEEENEYAQWVYLFDDPMFELRTLTIPQASGDLLDELTSEPKYRTVWTKVRHYQPSSELTAMLEREQLTRHWQSAFDTILNDPDTERAFAASGDQTEESTNALARAVVAQLVVCAYSAGDSGPGREARMALVNRLLEDWDHRVFGLSGFFANLVQRSATHLLRRHRFEWSEAISLPIGDILLYQAKGKQIRQFIKAKVLSVASPVILLAHSLGGIACFELLIEDHLPQVIKLITFGSQAPFLYELGALQSLKPQDSLPGHFPPWLNLYDPNDFLSYLARPVFPDAPQVRDEEVRSDKPFPASHSAYLGTVATWRFIRDFIE